MRTTLLFSSLAQKRAGVRVGFRSVLMLAMTDLNVCTHKPPTNLLCCRLQTKLSDWQNVLQKIAESANIACTCSCPAPAAALEGRSHPRSCTLTPPPFAITDGCYPTFVELRPLIAVEMAASRYCSNVQRFLQQELLVPPRVV